VISPASTTPGRCWCTDAAGLARGTQSNPDLVATLRFLAHAPQELYSWFSTDGADGATRSVLAVAARDDALLATRNADHISIVPIRATGLADAVISALPPAAPARSKSFTFPSNELAKAAGLAKDTGKHARARHTDDEDSYGGGFLWPVSEEPGGPSGFDLVEAMAVLKRPRIGGGELFAASRDRYGHHRRCEHGLVYCDTVDGRYLLTQESSSGRELWTILTPASAAALADRLRRLLNGIQHPIR
jgi:ESX secretion-associated protein EspG